MTDPGSSKELAAQAAGALFYVLPSELKINEAVDPLLRNAVTAINSSGWIWSAESCQGHPDEPDLYAAWGHNTQPYLRLICRAEDLGDAVAALLAEAADEDDKAIGTPEMKLRTRPLRDGWMEFQVYVTAHNVATRNRGCQALERFGRAISQTQSARELAPASTEQITELQRYKQALQRANGFLIMNNLEPVKLEYLAHEPQPAAAEIKRLRRREYVMAQHDETGRYWGGPREGIPAGFAEVPERAEGGAAESRPAASKVRDWRAGCECNRVGLCFRCQAAAEIESLQRQVDALSRLSAQAVTEAQREKDANAELVRNGLGLDQGQTESLSGGNPSEKSACLQADHRGIAEARSSVGGNDGTSVPGVSIQSREPVGSNSAPVGRASPEQLQAKDVDPAPSIAIHEPRAVSPWRIPCAKCGAPPRVDLGQDLRFPADASKSAYRAQCSGNDCASSTFSRHSIERALEAWNREQIANGAPFPSLTPPPASKRARCSCKDYPGADEFCTAHEFRSPDALTQSLAAMCGWAETLAQKVGWTRGNAASFWAAYDAARKHAPCPTCDNRGEVGGQTSGGWEIEPCPECRPAPPQASEHPLALMKVVDEWQDRVNSFPNGAAAASVSSLLRDIRRAAPPPVLAPKFKVGEVVSIGEKGCQLEVLRVQIAYDLGVAGHVVATGIAETDLCSTNREAAK